MTLTQAKADLATWRAWSVWRKCLFSIGLTFITVLALSLAYLLVFEPLKFGYMRHMAESAQTADEESAAFRLAHRCGTVWELHVSEGTNELLDFKQLDAAASDPSRNLHVEIEWFETSLWDGAPYRAARKLTEKTNLRILLAGFRPLK